MLPSFSPLKCALTLAAACLPAWVAAATLYKWVDANGVTHYSDSPVAGAVEVQIQGAQGYKAAPKAGYQRVKPNSPPSAPSAYTALSVVSPEEGAVFLNNGGEIDCAAAVSPPLAPGHALWFVLDGSRVAASGSSAHLSHVPRGTHTLAAVVTDGAGADVIASAAVTFYVRQPSAVTPPVGPALQKPPVRR